MDYSALLIQIANQLYFLNQKGIKYLNIKALPGLEVKSVINGLEEIISKENVISSEPRENITTKKLQKYKENIEELPEIDLITEKSVKVDKNSIHNLKQKNINHNFDQTTNLEDSQIKSVSLSKILEKYRSCQNCALGVTRKKLVFGSGLSNPPVIFIGEGPGADEDVQGEPFVGRAGKLLTKMISAIGIERDDVYITNIVKCRPPGNRNPTPAEISCCLPIIKQQIEILNPKLIVTLGNIPTKTFIPDAPGITKARGKMKQYEKWKIIPTFHPSYLLRNRTAMPLAWDDFKMIMEFTFKIKQS